MKSIVIDAPAKINLFLEITGTREDGYHYLDSIMQSIDLCDTVTISNMSGQGIYICCSRSGVPIDDKNLAYIAARKFMETFDLSLTNALSIKMEKRIPMQAGLGGGSSDAAAVLLGMNTLFEINADMETLCRIGQTIGADVPFCLVGGTRHITGIGEKLGKISPMPHCHIVIAKPVKGAQTPLVYRAYDALLDKPHAQSDTLQKALQSGDLEAIAQCAQNALEPACPVREVALLKKNMQDCGALGTAMSGSGSAVFGIFEDRRQAKRCMRKLYELSQSVFLAHPCRQGVAVRRVYGL